MVQVRRRGAECQSVHLRAQEEAIQSAFRSPLVSGRLYDIERDVVKVVKMEQTKRGITLTVERESQGDKR